MGKDEDNNRRESELERKRKAAHYKLAAEDVEAKNKADKKKQEDGS